VAVGFSSLAGARVARWRSSTRRFVRFVERHEPVDFGVRRTALRGVLDDCLTHAHENVLVSTQYRVGCSSLVARRSSLVDRQSDVGSPGTSFSHALCLATRRGFSAHVFRRRQDSTPRSSSTRTTRVLLTTRNGVARTAGRGGLRVGRWLRAPGSGVNFERGRSSGPRWLLPEAPGARFGRDHRRHPARSGCARAPYTVTTRGGPNAIPPQ
jgi:hypothetical protein